MTTDDIFADVYSRSSRRLYCSDGGFGWASGQEGKMTPEYETSSDRDREEAVARVFGQRHGVRLARLSPRNPVDSAIIRDGVVSGWAKINVRTTSASQYPSAHIGVTKVVEAINLSHRTGLPLILIYGWSSGFDVRWHRVDGTYTIEIGGRRDRGDWQDQEPMVVIPVEEFRLV